MNFPKNEIITVALQEVKDIVESLSVSYITTQEEFDKLKQENLIVENNRLKNISNKKVIFICDNFDYNETTLIDLLHQTADDNPELLCDCQLIYIDNPYLRFELFYNKKYLHELKAEEISDFEKTHCLSFVLVSDTDNYFNLLSEKFIFTGIKKEMIVHLLQNYPFKVPEVAKQHEEQQNNQNNTKQG